MYRLGEYFLTSADLNFGGAIVPKWSLAQVIEVKCDGDNYKICFESCSEEGEKIQILEGNEFKEMILSDKEALNAFLLKLKDAESPMQISFISENVSDYIGTKNPDIKALFNEYWELVFFKNEEFESLCIADKIKKFQSRQVLWELTKSEFIQMLEYCSIRIPKACLEVIYVRNDNTMRLTTTHKAQIKAVFAAYEKLLNFVI